MRTENSPKYEAEMKAYSDKRDRETRAAEKVWQKVRADWALAGCTWMPMENCPFGALDNRYGFAGAILVTDGTARALVTVKRRFGTPMFWKKQPEMIYRDGMMCLEGGEVDPRDDLPKWWWKWNLTDEFGSMTYAGGEETGKEEVDFVPTIWTFLPDPPKPSE